MDDEISLKEKVQLFLLYKFKKHKGTKIVKKLGGV